MALWLPSSTNLVFEHQLGTDLATSAYNHATGTTTASVNGSWTGGTGFQDISGTGPKGLDFGFGVTGDKAHLLTVIDPNTGCAILAASGTNAALAATAKLWLDANPTAAETVTINGQAITFVASGATGFQVNIGATPQATAASIATLVNANTGTFGCTAYNGQSGINATVELTTVATGTGANSTTVATGSTACRFLIRNSPTTTTGVFGSGAAGEAVTSGLYQSGTTLQARNSSQGVGGLGTLTVPGAGYYFMSCVMEKRNFPELRVWSAGALLSLTQGTTAGRSRETSGNITSGLTGGGTGNAKQAFAAFYNNRILTLTEELAAYLAVQTALAGVGITVV